MQSWKLVWGISSALILVNIFRVVGCSIQKGEFDFSLGDEWHRMSVESKTACINYLKGLGNPNPVGPVGPVARTISKA